MIVSRKTPPPVPPPPVEYELVLTEDEIIGLGLLSYCREATGYVGDSGAIYDALPPDIRRKVVQRREAMGKCP